MRKTVVGSLVVLGGLLVTSPAHAVPVSLSYSLLVGGAGVVKSDETVRCDRSDAVTDEVTSCNGSKSTQDVFLKAIPRDGDWVFDSWSGCFSTSGDVCQLRGAPAPGARYDAVARFRDVVAPDVTLERVPAQVKRFAPVFAVSDPHATVSCRLDGRALSNCSSGDAIALADGPHSFSVLATDPSGNSSGETARFTVDTVAPAVFITDAPTGKIVARTATVGFSLPDPAETVCVLDGGAERPCASPYVLTGLADGTHTLIVRATDAAGNQGEDSARWTVAATPPRLTVTGERVDASDFEVSFESDNARMFLCSLDGATASACTSPLRLTGLEDGEHTLSITASDWFNTSAPVVKTWTVGTRAPQVELPADPPAVVDPPAVADAPAPAAAGPAAPPATAPAPNFTVRLVKRTRLVVTGAPAGVPVKVTTRGKTLTAKHGIVVFQPALRKGTKVTVRIGAVTRRLIAR